MASRRRNGSKSQRQRRSLVAVAGALALVVAACGGGSGGGGTPSASGGGSAATGNVEITMWHGYGELAAPGEEPNTELDSLKAQVDAFQAANPTIKVDLTYVNSDDALEKLTVALQGDRAPDVTYQYGTNLPQLATSPKVVDLTDRVAAADYNWNDFPAGERDVFTIDGKVYGVPALVDNLAVVYNKDLFAAAGRAEPTPDWTWEELVADAKALTDPGKSQFGLEWPIDGSETEVWKFVAMLWEAGGDLMAPDGKKTAFASSQGATALAALGDLAKAKALYRNAAPDSEKANQLFNANKIGMFITGPWNLADLPDANYGVQVMPSFTGGGHDTIAGPDAWVVMDNGDARVEAAWKLTQYLTAPEQVLADSLATGHLPTRSSVGRMPAFAAFATSFPGVDVFAANLDNVKKARPTIAAYPQISQALGNAVTSVVLGKATPEQALADAAQQADATLAAG
jgi:multiple sugar transport system substrate-binding protein